MNITLIPQNRKIPLVVINLSADKYPALSSGKTSHDSFFSVVDVSLDVDSLWRKVDALPKANSSAWKLDLVVHPQFKAQFGKRSDPVESQINLAPEIKTSLWQGMSLSAQLIIPLQNQLELEGDYVRPGCLALNQTLRLPQKTFVSMTAGYFTENRYGTDLEIKKYWLNGRSSSGAHLGYTGHASYAKGVWQYSTTRVLTSLFYAEYRVAPFDLSLRATYGKFLLQDKGWRWDVLRQFREVDIGFYILKTETGTNGGFNFSIPIFPSKYLPTGPLRARTAKYFPWEYRYWGLNENGIQYNTGNGLDDFMKRLNPDHIKGVR